MTVSYEKLLAKLPPERRRKIEHSGQMSKVCEG